MTTITKEKTVIDLVELAYGDCNGHKCRTLDFKTEGIKDLDIIQACLNKIGGYNEFTPAEAFKIVAHNNTFFSYIEIGREGSPCIYVHLPYWTHQAALKTSEESRRYSDTELQYMASCIMESAKAAKADEVTLEQYNTVRIWWD